MFDFWPRGGEFCKREKTKENSADSKWLVRQVAGLAVNGAALRLCAQSAALQGVVRSPVGKPGARARHCMVALAGAAFWRHCLRFVWIKAIQGCGVKPR